MIKRKQCRSGKPSDSYHTTINLFSFPEAKSFLRRDEMKISKDSISRVKERAKLNQNNTTNTRQT
jgi:hypothetical protein